MAIGKQKLISGDVKQIAESLLGGLRGWKDANSASKRLHSCVSVPVSVSELIDLQLGISLEKDKSNCGTWTIK